MPETLVLIVSPDAARRRAMRAAIESVPRWWAAPLAYPAQTRSVLSALRPRLVLCDAAMGADAVQQVHQAVHGGPDATDTHLVLLDPTAGSRHAGVRDDVCAHCRRCPSCMRSYPLVTGPPLVTLLTDILAADRPQAGALLGRSDCRSATHSPLPGCADAAW